MAINQYTDFFSNKQKILIYLRKFYRSNIEIFSHNIQEELGIKKSYTSTMLIELESEGFIKRVPIDKRKRIFLTENGYRITQSSFQEILTQNEITVLRKAKLLASIS